MTDDAEIKEYVLEEHPVEGGVIILKQRTQVHSRPKPEDKFQISIVGSTFEVICDLVVIDPPFEKRTRTVRHVFKNGGVAAAFYAKLLADHSVVWFDE